MQPSKVQAPRILLPLSVFLLAALLPASRAADTPAPPDEPTSPADPIGLEPLDPEPPAPEPADFEPADFDLPRPFEPAGPEQIPLDIPHGGRAVAISVDPQNDDLMVVASETGGLFRTFSRGRRWIHVSGQSAFRFTDVQHSSTDSNQVVASARRGSWTLSRGGLWFSANGGIDWSQADVVPPTLQCRADWDAFGVDYEPQADRFWAATSCGVAFSEDGGARWKYLPVTPGHGNDSTEAIEATAPGHLKILTGNQIKVTTDGGANWSTSNQGLPAGPMARYHNQLAVSPYDPNHLLFIFQLSGGDTELHLSVDNGTTWQRIHTGTTSGRPPFVRTAYAASGLKDTYDIYVGDGVRLFRASVVHGAVPVLGDWNRLTISHADPADLAFANNRRTPLLLATDGGLHVMDAEGAWIYAGDMGRGYNALQVTEVVGQVTEVPGVPHVYFATQDNDIWASADGGRTWPGRRGSEGYYLDVWRAPLPEGQTRINGAACAPCKSFLDSALLADRNDFPEPPGAQGYPSLIKPRTYLQRTNNRGQFDLTEDMGATWQTRFSFPERAMVVPQVAGPPENPVIHSVFQRSNRTPQNHLAYGLKRILGVLDAGAPIVSEVQGLGNLGTFPTMFAFYRPFGVSPGSPNFMIAPDVLADQMMISRDGGTTWRPSPELTAWVTRNGNLLFSWEDRRKRREFGQVTSFGFDPTCAGHILIGTWERGILRSFDNGHSWSPVAGSGRIPRVSSFFFTDGGEVLISSYGRGLWRLPYTCPDVQVPEGIFDLLDRPALFVNGVLAPLAGVEPGGCADCKLVRVGLDGKVAGWDLDAAIAKLGGPKSLDPWLAAGNTVRGLYVEGDIPRALVVAGEKVEDAQIALPAPRQPEPSLVLETPAPAGLPLAQTREIVAIARGFSRAAKLRILVNGEFVETGVDLAFADDGTARLRVPIVPELGAHDLEVEQDGADGLRSAILEFHLTVRDFPEVSKTED